jgi:uncharacterized protein (TIGR01777 family)
MKYLITGGTGFIGRTLIRLLSTEQCEMVVLTRQERPEIRMGAASVRFVSWDARSSGAWCEEMRTTNAVINMAGKNISSSRWTDRVKRDIVSSRIDATQALVLAMKNAETKPSVFISASAVGYYGDCHERIVTEDAPHGTGFLSELTVRWEAAAAAATSLGVRVASPRIGIALGLGGGALQKMALPFYLMAGGYLGSGRQMMPWIHVEDLVRAIVFPIGHEALAGAYNCCAPHPVTMKNFSAALGRALHRPCWTNVPSAVLNAVLGEASDMLLTGQNAFPEKLRAMGFQFHYEHVDDALQVLYHT